MGGFFMPVTDPEKQAEKQKRYRERKKASGVVERAAWMAVFYEESCPEWRDFLDDVGLPCVVSPVHDRDVWTVADEKKDARRKAGTAKKPHRHLLIRYPRAVSYEQVVEDFAFLKSKNFKYVKSLSTMAAYLCHLKSPDKAQYDPEGIVEFGGACWRDWLSDVEDLHAEMQAMREHIVRYARETGRADFHEFWVWCDMHNDTWSRLLDTKCSAAIERFMKSVRGAMKTGTWAPFLAMLDDGGEGSSDRPGSVSVESACDEPPKAADDDASDSVPAVMPGAGCYTDDGGRPVQPSDLHGKREYSVVDYKTGECLVPCLDMGTAAELAIEAMRQGYRATVVRGPGEPYGSHNKARRETYADEGQAHLQAGGGHAEETGGSV